MEVEEEMVKVPLLLVRVEMVLLLLGMQILVMSRALRFPTMLLEELRPHLVIILFILF